LRRIAWLPAVSAKAGAVSFDDALHPLHTLWLGKPERVMAAL